MARIQRKSDGRRIFTAEFKRKQIDRVMRGELTITDLSRKLGIARSLLQRWKRNSNHNHAPAITDGNHGAQVTNLRADQYIHELQLLVGKQALELEILRAELDALKKGPRSQGRAGR